MGREVRMIAPGLEHPKYPDDYYEEHLRGRYIPLHDTSFEQDDSDWSAGYAKWQEGYVESYEVGQEWRERAPEDGPTYTLFAGRRPSPDEYMPKWRDGEATMLVMYEDTSEGTPISPPFSTPEELARWLADNNASAFAGMTAAYDQWLPICKGGLAPSLIIDSGSLKSGVEAMASGS